MNSVGCSGQCPFFISLFLLFKLHLSGIFFSVSILIKGMKYLHKCKFINGHGWLNSRNCLINENWQVKIHNFCLDLTNENNSKSNNNSNNKKR